MFLNETLEEFSVVYHGNALIRKEDKEAVLSRPDIVI